MKLQSLTNQPHHGKVHLAWSVSSFLYLQCLFKTFFMYLLAFTETSWSPCKMYCYCPILTQNWNVSTLLAELSFTTAHSHYMWTDRQEVELTGTHNLSLWMYQIHKTNKMTPIWSTSSLPPRTKHKVIMVSENRQLPLPVRSLIVLI